MAKPAARRLLDIIKKKRRKSMVTKLLPGKLGTLTKKRPLPGSSFFYNTAGNIAGDQLINIISVNQVIIRFKLSL